MAIILRSSKDSALTFAEMDGNITDLDTRISAIDSAFIKAVAGTDSANVIKVVQGTVDSAYVRAKVTTDQNLSKSDSVVFSSLQVTGDLVVNGTTTTLSSNTLSVGNRNVILADSAANAAAADSGGVILRGANANILYKVANDKWNFNKGIVAPDLAGKYLGAESDFSDILANTTTDSLSEGTTNLYHTNTRVDQRINLVVDANYIQSRQANFDFLDSAEAIAIFDSAYINARVNPDLFTDSAEVVAIADSAYVQLRQDKAFASLTGKPTTVGGYGITDAVKTDGSVAMLGVLNLNSNAITNVTTLAANTVNANVNATTGAITTVNSTNVNTTNLDVTGTADFAGATITGLDVTDSVAIINLIDATHVQARQIKYNTSDFTDSAFVTSRPISTFTNDKNYLDSTYTQALIDGDYVRNLADSAYIRTVASDLDSDLVIKLIDSAYVNLRADNLDSGLVTQLIDSAYVIQKFKEVDTLDTVVGRGDSTNTALKFHGGITVTGGISTDSIANSGIGFGALTSASDIQLSANNGSGVINALTSKITNVGTPTSSADAATKNYVDSSFTAFRNDYIIAELGAKTTTTNTDAFMPLNTTPVSEHSPTVGYSFSGTEAIRTDIAGHYTVGTTVTWFKKEGQNSLKVALQHSTGSGFNNIPGGMGTINCGDSGFGSISLETNLALGVNDLIRVNIDQNSVSPPNTNDETNNYISSPGITGEGAHPGYSILKVMKIG